MGYPRANNNRDPPSDVLMGEPSPGQPADATELPSTQQKRAISLGQLRTTTAAKFRALARSTGLPEGVSDIMVDAVDEVGQASLRPGRVRASIGALRSVADASLDRTAGLCLKELVHLENAGQLEDTAERARRGVARAVRLAQLSLAAAGVALAGPSEGTSLFAVVGLDLALGQVMSMIQGISDWYLVGTFAVRLLRQAEKEPDAHTLRQIVDAALLSRHGRAIDAADLDPRAEVRLALRWVRTGVLDAVPGLPVFGRRSVRHAGRCLEATDLAALAGQIVAHTDG